MSVKIYLDDRRVPPEGRGFFHAKTVDEFKALVEKHGIPTYVSLDHNLTAEQEKVKEWTNSLKKKFEGQTGVDAITYLYNKCLADNKRLPTINVHTTCPAGYSRLSNYIHNLGMYISHDVLG